MSDRGGRSIPSLDTRGLLCPLPVIRTQDAIRDLPEGARLEVIADDPGTQADIPAWCRVHGHVLEGCDVRDGTFRFHIRVHR